MILDLKEEKYCFKRSVLHMKYVDTVVTLLLCLQGVHIYVFDHFVHFE